MGLGNRFPGSLGLRRTEQLDRLRAGALNAETIQHFVDLVGKITEKLDLTEEDIWNMDESGYSFDMNRLFTYCKRGRKHVYASSSSNREHVSIVSAISAAGKYIPEFFIYKGKEDFDGALDGANPGADFKMAEKGYMTDEVWPFWVQHFLDCLPDKADRGYVVLYLDGFGSHV